MRKVDGKTKSVRELLKGVKYAIDYYQREYQWQAEQMNDLIGDLTTRFLDDYVSGQERKKVKEYGHYFLGSIIVSVKDGANYIVDGQQRLTSLTLLLIYLRHLQSELKIEKPANVDELVLSEAYGEKSFNLDIPERASCMDCLFEGKDFDPSNESESVQNLVERFNGIPEVFPEELRTPAVLHFVDWLLENVHLVEITAYSDDDAYTIFETMNDRGLPLTEAEMLKGYLLANVSDQAKRNQAQALWKKQVAALQESEGDESEFFKAWLRSQYATKIRERKKDAKNEDFDRMGTEFHRWLRDQSETIGLSNGTDFANFIQRDFGFYSRQYLKICEAEAKVLSGFEHIAYIQHAGFSLYPMLLLAPLTPSDTDEVVRAKFRLVSQYLDILLARRLWNSKSIGYSTMQYAMFNVMLGIRRLSPANLAQRLHDNLQKQEESFEGDVRLRLQQQNRSQIHYLLARISDWLEMRAGNESSYTAFMNGVPKVRYEIEHVWANKPERHTDEFPQVGDFTEYRNRIGGLLLLPKKFNASFGALDYAQKLAHYVSQNLLARSLHPQCYDHNPGFVQLAAETGLPFRAHLEFKKADLEARSELYRRAAKHIWDPALLLGHD